MSSTRQSPNLRRKADGKRTTWRGLIKDANDQSCSIRFLLLDACCFRQLHRAAASAASACARPEGDGTENKVAALEKKVEDLQLKGQIVSSILFKLSEQRFLHSTRFWTEVYDSAHASCARNKLEDTRIARGACADETNENQRQQCFEDVAVNASRGQLNCGNLQ